MSLLHRVCVGFVIEPPGVVVLCAGYCFFCRRVKQSGVFRSFLAPLGILLGGSYSLLFL